MHQEPVRLMHYDPRWRQEFEQTRSSVLLCCDGWVTMVEHIGSTAISGLIARPTIDVLAIVDSREGLEPAALLIEGLNYRREVSPWWADDAIMLLKPGHAQAVGSEPTHRVFLVVRSSATEERTVGIRNYLRSHPETAVRLEAVKVASWRSGEGDLASYEADKSIFFAHLEDQRNAGQS